MPVTSAVKTTTAYHPTREPVFTQTGQIGIVVRDLDATLRRFAEEFGIGPWQIWEVTPENAPDLRHDGEPLRAATRSAVAMVGGVMWEVSQPLDEHGIFARFLAERGEGVHHIAVTTPDFRGAVAMVGGVMWEVSQPLDEHGIFARFLAERGEGVHHIAVTTPDFRGAVA